MMNAKNISVITDLDCTGCGACFNSCPVNAIRMDWDKEGFLSPVIDEKLCISCGKCLSACPIKNPVFDNSAEPKCYAAMAADEIRDVSSSGGLFTLFANKILSMNGLICGAAFRDDFLVEHVIIDKYEDLPKLRGSKYLQSDTGKVFSQLKTALDEGRHVLFCGCPCHVAGLNSFLKKRYENLLAIDLMCHGGPSPRLFIKYLRETYPGKEIESFSFRDKSVFGWPASANIYFKDGTSRHVPKTLDLFYHAFTPCLSVRKSCGICKFATLPRQGDITLADFWGAKNYDPNFDDGKGTSILIINSEQGAKFHDLVKDELKLNAEFPLDYVKTHGQPLARPFMNNPDRKRFFEIVENNSFAKAVNYIKYRKFDAGIIGVWPGLNYGSVLTYYALQKSLKDMGLSPLMIDKPGASGSDQEMRESHSRRFAKKHFNISKSYSLKDLGILNRHCDSFIIGSDQVWNYGISRNFGRAFYLNFAYDDKKRIAFASSFGHKVDFAPPAQRAAISCLMQKFDAISVREDDGVEICRDIYHVHATQVLDPVFLLDTDHYARLADESQRTYPQQYLLAYLLDASEEKKKLLQAIATHLRLEPLILLDGFSNNAEKNRKFLDMDKNIFANPEVVDWLGCFKNAAYVLTDSFHGMCFSILFKKQFLAVMNKGRGFSRFQSLGRLLELQDRLVINPLDAIKNRLYDPYIDYVPVDQRLNLKKDFSHNWLHDAMIKPKVVDNFRAYTLIEKNTSPSINENQIILDEYPEKTHKKHHAINEIFADTKDASQHRRKTFMNGTFEEIKVKPPYYTNIIPKNKRCLVFRSNGAYAKGIGLTLLAIQEYQNLDEFDVVIYNIDWSPNDLEAIRIIKPDAFFINHSYEKICEQTNIPIEEKIVKRYGAMTLLHYELIFLLDKYEQILSLDSDLIICGNIDGIFNAKKGLAFRSGLKTVLYKNINLPFGNGGLILYNNTINSWDFSRIFLRNLIDSGWRDEIAIPKTCHDLQIEIENLDHAYNMGPMTIDDLPIKKDVIIYHPVGLKKIWNSTKLLLMFPEYRKFIEQWIKIGGTFSFDDYDNEFPLERAKQIQILNNTGKFLKLLTYLGDLFAKDYRISFPEILKNNILIKIKFSENYFQIRSIRYNMIFRFCLKIVRPAVSEEILRKLATESLHFYKWSPKICGFYFDFAIGEIYKIKEFMKYYNETIMLYLE